MFNPKTHTLPGMILFLFFHLFFLSTSGVVRVLGVCVCVLAGKGKVKVKGIRTLRGGNDPVTASAVEQRMNPLDSTLPSAGVRSLGGSAPGTPTEAEAVINQSATTGSWSRNSLRGSKCNSNSSTLSKPLYLYCRFVPSHLFMPLLLLSLAQHLSFTFFSYTL